MHKLTFNCFVFAAGHPHFLHHPVQAGSLWRARLSPVGSGDRLGHCHGLHHLDSFGCHSHIVGATWLIHAGDIYFIFASSNHVYGLSCPVQSQLYVFIIGELLPQKLKLSITPYALNEMAKMPYYERGGRDGYPAIAVISSSISLQDKTPIQTNLWCVFATISGRVLMVATGRCYWY